MTGDNILILAKHFYMLDTLRNLDISKPQLRKLFSKPSSDNAEYLVNLKSLTCDGGKIKDNDWSYIFFNMTIKSAVKVSKYSEFFFNIIKNNYIPKSYREKSIFEEEIKQNNLYSVKEEEEQS